MKKIIVNGGRALSGEILPQGSKNAALPILFASLLVDGISEISNVPDIGDVQVAVDILHQLGAKTERYGTVLSVDARRVKYRTPDRESVRKIRASSYLLGACLARFGIAEIMEFGGCNFDLRPIDLHIYAATVLGARLDGAVLRTEGLKGSAVEFPKPSVGATINALLMATSAEGQTVIKGGAREPHVFALVNYLRSAGADIREVGDTLTVRPATLKGAAFAVIPDMIEAGTYLYLAPLTEGKISVVGDFADCLDAPLSVLSSAGASVRKQEKGGICVFGVPKKEINIATSPYPGYPTDLQPQLAPIMAKYRGGSITEGVWLGRFGYLSELSRFGISYDKCGNTAWLLPSRLSAASVTAPDLRGGMACLMCALAAEGRSEIYSADTILRGYSSLAEKLSALGADVKIC